MAFAFWRILRTPETSRRRAAIILFALLLISNAAWSWMFFGAKSPVLGSLISGPSLQSLVRRLLQFGFWIGGFAFACPLAIWVAFAAVLFLRKAFLEQSDNVIVVGRSSLLLSDSLNKIPKSSGQG